MLDLNPDIVRAVVSRAREFQAKESVVIPNDGGDSDWAMQSLASHGGDLSLQEVRALIDDLEPDQQTSLMTLMWIGRGDYGAEEWDEAYEEARDAWNERVADYLLATPMVADYLEEGLSELGYSLEE